MRNIVAGITSLLQHRNTLKQEPEQYRPERCACCGMAGLWHHGHYDRKSDRENVPEDSFNPVPIPRFYCPHCHATCSVLPECIPPRRWYLWVVQALVLLKCLVGESLRKIHETTTPSRSTARRWFARLTEQFLIHRDTLCTHLDHLSCHTNLNTFWPLCLSSIPFSKAMLICHQAGVLIP